MRHAARLLRRTDLPVESVADRVGLSSRSHFSQLFVSYHGVSPSDFRAAAHP
jgi:AraC-like DNA-binding protein